MNILGSLFVIFHEMKMSFDVANKSLTKRFNNSIVGFLESVIIVLYLSMPQSLVVSSKFWYFRISFLLHIKSLHFHFRLLRLLRLHIRFLVRLLIAFVSLFFLERKHEWIQRDAFIE